MRCLHIVGALTAIAAASPAPPAPAPEPTVKSITCGSSKYEYNYLAGYGSVPGDAKDSTGDTLGGIGSSMAIDKKTWKLAGHNYMGTLWALPDRGFNVNGSTFPRFIIFSPVA